jgi:FkbM family methyltransferase
MTAVFVYGAGQLGRKIAADHGAIHSFIDDTPEKKGTAVDGIPVIGFDNFAQRYADQQHQIYVCICLPDHCVYSMMQTLKKNTDKPLCISPFTDYFLNRPDTDVMPHLFWHKRGLSDEFITNYEALKADLSDEDSIACLEHYILFQSKGLIRHSHCTPRSDIPFRARLNSNIHYIDCGAFDGDTITDFLTMVNEEYRAITAVEPDKENLQRCKQRLESLNGMHARKTVYICAAVSDRDDSAWFASNGSTDSKLSESGTVKVDTINLKRLITGPELYIKLDIEGAEYSALAGAVDTIIEHLPYLAISVYHHYDDLVRIHRLLKEAVPEYRFALRTHGMNGTDTMLYCFPGEP